MLKCPADRSAIPFTRYSLFGAIREKSMFNSYSSYLFQAKGKFQAHKNAQSSSEALGGTEGLHWDSSDSLRLSTSQDFKEEEVTNL